MDGTNHTGLEGTRPNAYDYGGHKPYRFGGHPAPDGASPTQPYKCGQNVKVNTNTIPVGATVPGRPPAPRRDDPRGGRPVQCGFDFHILTAFIRLGRAGPAGAGCPPILYGLRLGRAGPAGAGCPPYYHLTLLFDFLPPFPQNHPTPTYRTPQNKIHYRHGVYTKN